MNKDKKYVRRGFDIELDLYNRFRSIAIRKNIKTKDLLTKALKYIVNLYEKKELKRYK